MAGRIPRDFIEDLIARSDIVDIIESRVPLKRGGQNYIACCPFHKEKSPSFTVTPSKQFYYCFGCGAHGNALGFLMEYDRSSFVEAVETLASKIGVQVPYEAETLVQRQRSVAKKKAQATALSSLSVANAFYKQQLRQHPSKNVAVDYLKSRGVSGKVAQQFQVGYAPPGWDNLLNHLKERFSDDQELAERNALAAGLVVEKDDKRKYDRFRERIMFPIRNIKGDVIGFGGRVLTDEKPKYLNSPETEVFQKSEELYGLYEALEASNPGRVMIVEGYMDVIAMHQFGITNVVATLGTATGAVHVNKLFKLVKEVIYCFDGDDAGRRAAWRGLENALPLLQEGRQIKFLFLPDGEDPDTLVRKEGVEVFQHRMDTATPLTQYLLDGLGEGKDLDSIDGRAQLVSESISLLKMLPNNLIKEMLVKEVADQAQVDVKSVAAKVEAELAKQNRYKKSADSAKTSSAKPEFDSPPENYPGAGYPADEYGHNDHLTNPPYDYSSNDFATSPARNNGAGWRKPHNARFRLNRKTASISLVETLIRGLLQSPNLAQSVQLSFDLKILELPQTELLSAMIDQFKADATLSLPALFGLWHSTDQGQQLADIAAKEFLIEGSQTEQEFNDGIRKLQELYCRRALELEINCANPDGEKIKSLLEQQRTFEMLPLESD